MAFRPLDFFRIKKKATKVILAILGIMCMFLFVVGDMLIGSRSDRGTGLGRTIRGWFGSEDYLAKVDNRAVNEDDLFQLSRTRQAVFQFTANVRHIGHVKLYQDAGFTYDEAQAAVLLESNDSSAFQRIPREVLQSAFAKLTDFRKNRPDELSSLLVSRATLTSQYPNNVPSFLIPEDLVEFLIWKKKADELGILLGPSHVKDDLIRAAANHVSEDQFGAIARQLKLRMDVDALLSALGDEMRVMIARGAILGARKGEMFSMSGSGERLSVQVTPLDLWDAYTKVKTHLTVGILPIAVNQKEFLSQVKDPTAEELKEFFNKHKDQAPDANRDTPGFKVPELYKIEFIYADLRTNDYYRKWAEAVRALDPAGFQYQVLAHYMANRHRYRTLDPYAVLVSGAGLADAAYYKVPLPLGPGPWASLAGVQQQTAADYAMSLAGLAAAGPLPPLGFSSVLQPGTEKLGTTQAQQLEIASLVLNTGHGLPGVLSYPPRLVYTEKYEPLEQHYAAIADEVEENNRRLVLEGDLKQLEKDLEAYSKEYEKALARWKQQQRSRSKPIYGPGAAKFEPPLFTVKKDGDKPEPERKLQTEAKPDAEKPDAAVSAIGHRPSAVGQKVEAGQPTADSRQPIAVKDEKIPIEEYLKRFAAARGLLYEGMAELRSREDLFKETGKSPLGSVLKPVFVELEEAFRRRFMPSASFDNQRFQEDLARTLTDSSPPYEARQAQAPSDSRGPGPMLRGEKQWQYAVYWKSARTEARTPTFEEAQTSIYPAWTTPVDAWRLDKARDLAKQRTETLAKEVAQSKPDGYRKLKDLEDYRDDQVLARFERALDVSATAAAVNYRSAKPPVIEKETSDLLDQALTGLKEKGDAIVVHNRPKSFYYVLVLKERDEPKAVNPEALKRFDQEVIIPDRINQLQVNGQPISEFALQERAQSFIANWEKGLRERARYDAERGQKIAEELVRAATERR